MTTITTLSVLMLLVCQCAANRRPVNIDFGNEGAASDTKDIDAKRIGGLSSCQTMRLDDELWYADSYKSCFATCKREYGSECLSVVYNKETQECRFGGIAFPTLEKYSADIIPNAVSKGSLYFAAPPAPVCDTEKGFRLFSSCGVHYCLYFSSEKTSYHIAALACTGMGGKIAQPDTMAKFSMFWRLTGTKQPLRNYWVGLIDIRVEGTFEWDDGTALSKEMGSYIWNESEPNNSGNIEHCAEAPRETAKDKWGLNDSRCGDNGLVYDIHYVCEM